jgi:hypothetical protein
MSKTDDLLGPGFEWRLRTTLDRVQPPHTAPRYESLSLGRTLRAGLRRAAPMVAIGVAGLLLTAYAGTGSPNPVIWTQNAASAFNSITHGPQPVPVAEPSSAPVQQPDRAASQPKSEQDQPEGTSEQDGAEPAEPAEPAEKHEPVRSTHPSDDH